MKKKEGTFDCNFGKKNCFEDFTSGENVIHIILRAAF